MSIKPALEVASLVAAVVGVILLVVQTSQMTKQTEALREDLDQSARQEVFSRTLDAGQVVLENPLLFRQIRAPANDPEAVKLKAAIAKNPESMETHRAYQLANFFIDFYDYILSGYPIDQYPALNVVTEDESFAAWSTTVGDFFTPGSLACSQFISNQANYGRSYVERVRGAGLCPGL
ncbi:hypothetical protein [Micromonospora sp. B006]|uniref:hypothetical protein n=1 Tax=Micromonospora sp. B006 TaxID=2201999 RepID=UPI0012602C58|nr:hypothetical protein [Micromonospora sp. B006]